MTKQLFLSGLIMAFLASTAVYADDMDNSMQGQSGNGQSVQPPSQGGLPNNPNNPTGAMGTTDNTQNNDMSNQSPPNNGSDPTTTPQN